MSFHNGLLPREGFNGDAVFKILGKTAFNPLVVLPLVLAARFTRKGEELAVLHPTAFRRLHTLLYFGIARYLNRFLSNGALNNWKSDRYVWSEEIVLITGGAGGIGGHMVRMFAEKGVTVVVLDIQPLDFEAPSNVHYLRCDLTNSSEVTAVAAQVRSAVGDPTVLINNAGVARGKSLLESSERDVRFTFDVNTFSHYWTTREFLPAMVRRDHGMIVTVASYAAWLAVPNMIDYAASKSAAYAFHEGLTAELPTRYGAPRVRTVVVNQGYTKTPLFTGYNNDRPFMLPAQEPESVAEAIVRQVLSGRSGQIIMPKAGNSLPLLAAMPHWWQIGLRKRAQNIMTNFRGTQVVRDLDTFYAGRGKEGDKPSTEPESSTVLV